MSVLIKLDSYFIRKPSSKQSFIAQRLPADKDTSTKNLGANHPRQIVDVKLFSKFVPDNKILTFNRLQGAKVFGSG